MRPLQVVAALTALLILSANTLRPAPADAASRRTGGRADVGDLSRGALDGWQTEGAAWGIAQRQRAGAVAEYHAESLAGGEQAVGVLRSEPFTVTGNILHFLANGWDGRYGGKGVNGYYLRRAADGELLRAAAPPCSDAFTLMAWPVADLVGERVIFEAMDGDRGDAFAWLGVSDVYQVDYPASTLRPLRIAPAGTWAILERDGGRQQVPPYLSSLGGGERGTGVVRSPEFVIETDVIRFDLCGHDSEHGGLGANFAALRDAHTGKLLRQTAAPGRDAMTPVEWNVRDLAGRRVVFEVWDGLSADGYAWLGVNNLDAGPALRATFEAGGLPAGWNVGSARDQCYVTACGVPFLGLSATESIVPAGGEVTVRCGFPARRVFLLGMTNTWDHGSPVWGTPTDYSDRLFIGDRIGHVIIEYADGTHDAIPLRLGHTAWWYADYAGSNATAPFASDGKARAVLERSLDIYPTDAGAGHAYLCAIRPRDKTIAGLRFVDNPAKRGAPAITAVTVDTDEASDLLGPPIGAAAPSDRERRWLAEHIVAADAPATSATYRSVTALRHLLYSSANDIPARVSPDIPRDFRGPRVRFAGTPIADLLTNIYYHSTQDMDDKVDADGTFHTSTKDAPSWGGYQGVGAWNPRHGAYYDHAWSRDLGRVLQELTELGYEDDAQACARWCDEWLQWFPQQFPRIHVNDRPVPGHWVRIINHPEWTQTTGTPAGFGNLENDGHGLIMLFQYRTWLHAGRRPDYVLAKWAAIREAAEYVCWLLDHPDISRAHDDVLFSDSEGGGMQASIYCDLPCWLGLTAYAAMAEAAGEEQEALRWRDYARRLQRGISRYYPTQEQEFGDIWDPSKAAVWPFGHSVLAPVLIWPDYHGLDTSRMPSEWLARSRRTFRRQLTRCRPDHASGVAMGYGQCFITQAALLLDEMADASRCVDWLARFTYYPRYKPYIVPEGCETDSRGRWWHRTGDLGNAVQEGEAIKCARIILGTDDTDPACTLFIPRVPQGWTEVRADGYPVMTLDGDNVVRREVGFRFARTTGGDVIEIRSDAPLAGARVRLGPYPPETRRVKVTLNGKAHAVNAFLSGDSSWAWVDAPARVTRLSMLAKPEPS
ncbi:MAG: hypothetical protein JSV65_07490 [Armatimonadota bacterium]|nr:MAG: hypothetical protein JSV65_07490 [Armatimonadota bacterium]